MLESSSRGRKATKDATADCGRTCVNAKKDSKAAAAVIGADPIVRRRGLVRKLVRVGRGASKFTSRRYLEESEPVGKEAAAIIQMSGLVFVVALVDRMKKTTTDSDLIPSS